VSSRVIAAIFACATIFSGGVKLSQAAAPDLPVDLICLTDRPVVLQGESATLQMWAVADGMRAVEPPVELQWQVDNGRVDGPVSSNHWDLSSVKLDPEQEQRTVTASGTASRRGQTVATCQVRVIIGRKAELPPDRAGSAQDLFSAKHYLLPNEAVLPGYGLYSYLLFSAPPRDADEKVRYLKTIEACLALMREVDEYLARHVRPRSLNITYIPVVTVPQKAPETADLAKNVLQSYDYATASILLAMAHKDRGAGPYLLATTGPLSAASSVYLWQDFTGVVPELAWDRVRFFTYLAAQQRSWSQETLGKLAFSMRNIIAVGGEVIPQTREAAEKAVQFVSVAAVKKE
jgi:hypothetical protein